MMSRFSAALARWCAKWVPDPFVLAVVLTGLVALLGTVWQWRGGHGLGDTIWLVSTAWADGLANSAGLAFALQMCLVLVTGHAIAMSPPMQRAVAALARRPQSAPAASAMVALVACLAALVHWGLGAIAGALLAREIGRHAASERRRIHYPILGAAAYSGMAVWHGGLSGSAPLKMAENGVLPIASTLGSSLNLVTSAVLVTTIVALYYALTPRTSGDLVAADPRAFPPLLTHERPAIDSPIAWLQESPWVGRVLGLAICLWLASALMTGRRTLEINSVNLLFFATGLFLQGGLRHYMEAIGDGARAAGAIIVQFPLYFGILGVMKATGLITAISGFFAATSSATSFPLLSFLSAGLVNLFVPSGGGQWAVQRDVLLDAGSSLGVDPGITVMAFAYGDAWTNMLQPFWALPLLGIMGLRARDIIGYTTLVFLALAVVVPVMLVAMAG